MEERIQIQPLPKQIRRRTFGLLLLIFLVSIPFLYLYATGYRLDLQKPTNLVSTGGVSLAVQIPDAQIFIDGEPVKGARTFRRVYYIQGVDVRTHRVHVQKDGYHTWVKELPVSERLVTEAVAFNLPLVPHVRVISPWVSATGTPIVRNALLMASTTNEVLATSTRLTSVFTRDPEFQLLKTHFATSTATTTEERPTVGARIEAFLTATSTATSTPATATTTRQQGGVRLFEDGGELYALWVNSFDSMPYYYCAADFPRYSSSTTEVSENVSSDVAALARSDDAVASKDPEPEEGTELVLHPVQTVPENIECDPRIRMDHKAQAIRAFDFLPGSTDFVILALEDGIYVVEIDDRAWQNVQPLIMGKDLHMYIENGSIYVYDGTLIYQIINES